jgi:hypothetical protein
MDDISTSDSCAAFRPEWAPLNGVRRIDVRQATKQRPVSQQQEKVT